VADGARETSTVMIMGQFHWDPHSYLELMHSELPDYERLQDELVHATRGMRCAAILELGTGTGETARRVLDAHPGARLLGIDASAEMLAAAREALAGRDVTLELGRLEDALPQGRYDLVVSALAVHHLDAAGKAELFTRVAELLGDGGRFVLADVVVPVDGAEALTPLDPEIDLPSSVDDQLRWLHDAGLKASVAWMNQDLAVLVALR
jgi:tRNA (cmo5U34)-methyltransferase